MGNICRSPAAEGVMKKLVNEAGLSDQILIDSAGTGGWHAGEKADRRMRAAAHSRGYELESLARQVNEQDIAGQDLILIMDTTNEADLKALFPKPFRSGQVRWLVEFCRSHTDSEVPDPYYGGQQGFEHVLDLLEDSCAGVLEHIQENFLADSING